MGAGWLRNRPTKLLLTKAIIDVITFFNRRADKGSATLGFVGSVTNILLVWVVIGWLRLRRPVMFV